jgi:hypothetical protein
MTKISELTSEFATQQAKKTNSSETQGDLFKKALENAVSSGKNDSTANGVLSSKGLGELRATGINMIVESSPAEVVSKTESLLSVMDKYIENLKDPSVTLKQIEPLAEQMKVQSTTLKSEAENCNDSKIKDIAERSAVEANVEYFKFMRGDYI